MKLIRPESGVPEQRVMQLFFCLLTLVLAACAHTSSSRISGTSSQFASSALLYEWLTEFNSGDPARLAQLRDKFQIPEPLDDVLAWREGTGGHSLLRMEENRPDLVVALLKEVATDHVVRARIETRSDGRLYFHATPITAPPEYQVQRTTLDRALASMRARADRFAKLDKFSGALLVARDGRVLFQDSWGESNRETHQRATLDTQYRLGSMNKMFTAIAVLQLVEAGKLSLDGTVGRYLPDYPNAEVASKVTLRQILTHTAGMGDIFGAQFLANRDRLREHQNYIDLYGSRAPEFEPGTQDGYSNYGFVILGAVIERVTGQSYYDYMQRNVYDVSDMKLTGSLPESVDVPGRAAGYTWQHGAWVSNADVILYRGVSAGGGYSTVGDLLRFANCLQAGRLISLDTLVDATHPHDHGGTNGYGFTIKSDGDAVSYGHGGGAPGMDADLRIYPETGYVLIGLSNLDPRAAKNMLDNVAVRLPIKR
ncbi:MAG TPA: serine hydrolase domain-containing protein [Steroidobacteraceae bacterium]|jgi:CubicO group peptidase (beta-lactamase class C family)